MEEEREPEEGRECEWGRRTSKVRDRKERERGGWKMEGEK